VNASSLRVAVIGGGQNCEHDVSIASAAAVAAAIEPSVRKVVSLTIAEDGRWLDGAGRPLGATTALSLARAVAVLARCDVALPIVHGPRGEDGTLAALFELADVPYVGSGVRGGALAMDKWTTKLIADELGIRTAPGVLVTACDADRIAYDHPVVVKPVASGSSMGVTLVRNAKALAPALARALALDSRALVEEFVIGREVDVAVLERADGSRLVGPALEIVTADDEVFDVTTKYDGSADFRLPAKLDDVERKEITDAALVLFEALGCRGLARFDFFMTSVGPVLNEVNTMPGMTAQSQVPRMFAAAGISYANLLGDLIQGALARHRNR
jgi:D-alanine-D-alanine ligase